MKFTVLLLTVFSFPLLASAIAAETSRTFESSRQQVPLIELFTSQGCSSCPPADEWVSELQDEGNLWTEFVPVVFHVDYWDYIGWKDRFARKEFSQRQRHYATEAGERTVYTPGMRKAGQEWRSWRLFGKPELSRPDDVGKLSLTLLDGNQFKAEFMATNSKATKQVRQLTIAVLGVGLQTDIKRGENRGKTLNHDFVVLDITTLSSNDSQWSGQLPKATIEAPRYAIAAWITEGASLKPVQAVGGYLAKQ